ncbi:GNAT family N-acetyltransferase [uncultured Microscilla sp.]|uniref:GNAT family N-acetyltransferase n=1 Tax=uncultured Microscilla sp. TaxID=432653 RepID=UPI00260D79F6|nr:GNAT family N-acetyltransferase [uncultured Microscilla sp.]
MNIEFVNISKELHEQCEAFVLQQPNTLLYQTIKYQSLITALLNVPNETIVALVNNEVKGIFPLMAKDGKFGKVYNSLPFYGSNGGPIGADETITQALIEEYVRTTTQDNVAASTLVTNPLDEVDYSKLSYHLLDERAGQFTKLDFDNPKEDLMQSFHYKTRNMVRKGMKNDIEVIVDNNALDFLYDTHVENMKAIGGIPKSKKFFDLIATFFKGDVDYKIYTASKDGSPISALLLFYYKGVVEYFTPVIKVEYRNLQPNSVLIYQAMTDAAKEGFKWWNWGGTWPSQENLYRFKSRWGGQDFVYKYFVHINNKDIYNATPEELLSEYSNFYVLPFNALKS